MPYHQFLDGNGCPITLFEYEGRLLTRYPKYWQDVTSMTSRPDDVLICSYPKSGLHWLWEIVTMLVGGVAEHVEGHMELNGFLMVTSLKHLEELPSPRVLTTHRHFQDLPQDFVTKGRKMVCVLREPKDVCVSYYNMLTTLKVVNYEGTFEGFLPLFLEGKVPFGRWTDWVLSFEQGIRNHPALAVHTVCYEELKQNPVKEIKRLASFLGASSTLAEKVAEKTEFSLMKQAKERLPNPMSAAYKNNVGTIFRTGESNSWRQWFSEEQIKIFDARLKQQMNRPDIQAKL